MESYTYCYGMIVYDTNCATTILRLALDGASKTFLVAYEIHRVCFFFFSSRRRHTRLQGDWSSDVCSSDLGSAEIDLFFDWNVDMFQTLQYVNAAISRVQPEIPPTATVVANRMTFASFPIIGYSLTSQTVLQTQLWEMATYEIKPRLNRMDGVSTVLVQGGQQPEFHITPDPAKLLAAGVTVTDLLDTMRRTNLIDSPGLLERNHRLVLGLISGQVRTPEQIANTVVKSTQAGIPVRIGDVASVAPAVKPVYTIVTANGKPAVLLNINRQPDSNTMQVATEV